MSTTPNRELRMGLIMFSTRNILKQHATHRADAIVIGNMTAMRLLRHCGIREDDCLGMLKPPATSQPLLGLEKAHAAKPIKSQL
jgi:hypothetical protein